MARMNMVQALNSAMDVMLERDPRVVLLGEDVGYFGGVFRVTEGLQRKYGEHRVLDTPIAEGGIIATAIGMGVNGLKPVAEIQFADYIYPGFDQIVSELARLRYRTAGDFLAPVTIRTPCGGGIRGGQTHSQSPEAIFTHVCGIKVVMPSNPYDAKGLLISSIEDEDPVVFFEPKRIYNGPFDGDPHKPAVPVERASARRGARGALHRADRPRRGRARRARTDGAHLRHHGARRGGCGAARSGVDAEIVDVRTHGAARCRHAVHLGVQDRPLRRGARGHALRRLRRGARGDRAGAVLLEPGGAHPARHRLGYALSACLRVGLLPRARRASRRRSRQVMEAA